MLHGCRRTSPARHRVRTREARLPSRWAGARTTSQVRRERRGAEAPGEAARYRLGWHALQEEQPPAPSAAARPPREPAPTQHPATRKHLEGDAPAGSRHGAVGYGWAEHPGSSAQGGGQALGDRGTGHAAAPAPQDGGPPTDGVALGALVAAIAGFAALLVGPIIAFVLAAHAADNLRADPARRGRGLVIAARAVAGVALVANPATGWLLFGRLGDDPEAAAPGTATTSTSAPTTTTTPPMVLGGVELGVGHCLLTPADESYLEVEVVDCDAPHDMEIYAIAAVGSPDGEPFDQQAVEQAVDELCTSRWGGYVGRDHRSSELHMRRIYPSEETWEAGDREILCAIRSGDSSPLVGSMRGANR